MALARFILLVLLAAFPASAQNAAPNAAEIAYGPDARQRLDYSAAKPNAPLIVFVHGGSWQAGDKELARKMAAYFQARGYNFAALNHRFVPNVTADEQAKDVAAGIAKLVKDRSKLRFNRKKVLLIGHSSGAHLSALVAADPAYLAAHRLSPKLLDGVVLLDSAGYDVPVQVKRADPRQSALYVHVFGQNPDFQRRVSPIAHAAAPNAKHFLLLYVKSRAADSGWQAHRFGDALQSAGTKVEYAVVEDTHSGIFDSFASEGHEATRVIDAYARKILK